MADFQKGTLAGALEHHQAGRRRAAKALYQQILGADPDNPTALYLYGWLCFEEGETATAVALLRRVVALCPHHAAANEALAHMVAQVLGRARALLLQGNAAAARAILRAVGDPASLAAPLGPEAWFLAGRAAKMFHEFAAAIEAYRQAIADAPLFPAAYLDLGNCLAETERPEEAEQALRAAIAIEPELKEAHASLGSVLLLAGREKEAEESFRSALAIDAGMIVAHQNLAAICAETGRAAEAKLHRDAAYCRKNLFIERAARPAFTVLMPTTAEGGNVPGKFLFPRDRCTVLKWFIEYAKPGNAERLPPYDIVFNGIGDADAAVPATAALARFRASCRKPFLNSPAAVAATRRDRLAGLFAGIADVVVPDVRRLDFPELAATDMQFPVLLRPCGSHGGAGISLVPSVAALTALMETKKQSCYLTSFVPYRSADGWHRKYRVIFIAGRPFPCHLALAGHWLVHYATADMLSDPAKTEAEQAFLNDPETAIGTRAQAALRAIGSRLELDFAGIDFSVLPDGRLLVFEANATMLVHPESEPGSLAYRNRHVRSICDAFTAMISSRIAGASHHAESAAVGAVQEECTGTRR